MVHSHDKEMKRAVAQMLIEQDLEPIILDEQPDQGLKTIIGKIIFYIEDVSFAVVLFSPDDKGYITEQGPKNAKSRARQNVILELGLCVGKLGRDNIAVLFKDDTKFERPSDIDGVLYKPFDNDEKWKSELVKELQSLGYDVDTNRA